MADRVPLDFDPPVRQLRALLLGIDEHELAVATPCERWPVAALLGHVIDFSTAFAQAARKLGDAPGVAGPAPEPDPAALPAQWRSRLPVLIQELAVAWRDPAAWTGTSRVGGQTMPAATIGTLAMTELVLHSWDLARATGQDYATDPRTLEVLAEALSTGTASPVAGFDDEDSLLDQVVRLSGRDPRWRPRNLSAPSTAVGE